MKKGLLIVVGVLLFLGVSSFAAADRFTSVKEVSICGGNMPCSCGDTLVKDYMMTSDLTNCSGEWGLKFRDNLDYITLNCNGHTVQGIGKSGSTGIYLGSGERYTVTNCDIENFEDGVFMGEGWMTLSNNQIGQNSENGVFINVTYLKYIYDNIVGNNKNGIYISDSKDTIISNSIRENYISNNKEVGIYVLASPWLIIGNNTINRNGRYGIEIVGTGFTMVYANIFENNILGNAFEHNGSKTNTWNSTSVGNRWDDFESNPGYPYYYEVPGPGNGVDWDPNKL